MSNLWLVEFLTFGDWCSGLLCYSCFFWFVVVVIILACVLVLCCDLVACLEFVAGAIAVDCFVVGLSVLGVCLCF